jgi:hypothetical protein
MGLQKPVGFTFGYEVESFHFTLIGRRINNKKAQRISYMNP